MSDYAEHPLPAALHEDTDAPPRRLALGFVGMAVLLCLLAGLTAWLFPLSLRDKSIPRPLPPAPAPALQPSPRADMARFYAQEMAYLHGTGWVDRAHGIVHVPIAQAMQAVARDGIADWPRQGAK